MGPGLNEGQLQRDQKFLGQALTQAGPRPSHVMLLPPPWFPEKAPTPSIFLSRSLVDMLPACCPQSTLQGRVVNPSHPRLLMGN